jgi:serine phosphatase RsbU (regulator of sigma subunit)
MSVPVQSAWLIPLENRSGTDSPPSIEKMEIKPIAGGAMLGRHDECALRISANIDAVSRRHARFVKNADGWAITDLNSRWGTYINGIKLPAGRETSISDGDLIRIAPWTFLFRTSEPRTAGTLTIDDTANDANRVQSIRTRNTDAIQGELFNLLLDSAKSIHAASEEQTLAEIVIDAALRGTGMANGALLRPMDTMGNVSVIAQRASRGGAAEEVRFSRSLIAASANGSVAEILSDNAVDLAVSIVQSGIAAAICAPLMLGSTVAAHLYLYSRGNDIGANRARPNAAAFCHALAQMAGLALANLKRLEIERRWARMEIELSAMANAQRWLLPREPVRAGSFLAWGKSQPGEQVSGDFFDTFVLADGRLVITLGDVAGHGIGASILMAASQSFLHAAMSHHGDIARAVAELNSYLHTRQRDTQFVTLWAGVFDPQEMKLSYIDAGHGYAMLIDAQNEFTPLSAGEAMPLGIAADSPGSATTLTLPPRGRVLIVSDGIIEQVQPESAAGSDRQQFGVARLRAAIASTAPAEDALQALLTTVRNFADNDHLSDDATALLVEWGI